MLTKTHNKALSTSGASLQALKMEYHLPMRTLCPSDENGLALSAALKTSSGWLVEPNYKDTAPTSNASLSKRNWKTGSSVLPAVRRCAAWALMEP